MTSSPSASTTPGLIITRTFNAPKDAVFNAFADADALAQWWGPAGMAITVVSLDFQPGGKFHYKMEGHGQTMWGRFVYGNIARPDEIEFVSSFSDEAGNVCKSPFPMDFPLEIFNRITLSEEGGVTTLVLQGHPINATEAQETTYRAIIPNMEQGFGGTMDQLKTFLERQDAQR